MKNVQNCQNVKMSQSGSNILESKYRLPKRGMAAGGGHSDASSEGSSASMRPHRLNTLGESMRSLGGGPGLCTLSAVSGIKPGTLDRTEIRLTRWNAFVAKFGPPASCRCRFGSHILVHMAAPLFCPNAWLRPSALGRRPAASGRVSVAHVVVSPVRSTQVLASGLTFCFSIHSISMTLLTVSVLTPYLPAVRVDLLC